MAAYEERGLQRLDNPPYSSDKLQRELDRARLLLAEAEAELAAEQAAVNAFRMHCRLKLDDLVDRLLQIRSEKESLLVLLELRRQGVAPTFLDDEDPLTGLLPAYGNAGILVIISMIGVIALLMRVHYRRE